MNTINLLDDYDGAFVAEVEEASEQNLTQCYQCGNCTAGCPYTFAYDIPVSRIMRLIQTGQKETLLSSKSIWLCATCESCTTRCPNNIDVARVMDVLRHMARRRGYAAVPHVRNFWNAFLASVRAHGRVFELGLTVSYMLKTGRIWSDLDLGPKILPKGKLSLVPHNIHGKDQVAKIFKKFEEGEA